MQLLSYVYKSRLYTYVRTFKLNYSENLFSTHSTIYFCLSYWSHGSRPDYRISLLIGFYVLILFLSDLSYWSYVPQTKLTGYIFMHFSSDWIWSHQCDTGMHGCCIVELIFWRILQITVSYMQNDRSLKGQLSLPSLWGRQMSSDPCNSMDHEGGDH